MRKLFYIVFVGVVATMVFGACSKDEPATEGNAETRGAGVQDSTKGGGIKLNTEWVDSTTVNF